LYEYLEKSLKHYLCENTVSHIENNGSRCWIEKLTNTSINPAPSINIVFSRYQEAEVSETVITNHAYVLAIPSYWIDVDTTAAIMFISNYVDAWLTKYFGYQPEPQPEPPVPPVPPPPPPPPGPIPPGPIPPGPHPPCPHPPPPEPDMNRHPPVIQVMDGEPRKYGYPVPPGE